VDRFREKHSKHEMVGAALWHANSGMDRYRQALWTHAQGRWCPRLHYGTQMGEQVEE